MKVCLLLLGLVLPASAQMKFAAPVTPVMPVSPAIGNLALPAPNLGPALGESLLSAPALTPVLPLIPNAVIVPNLGPGRAVPSVEPIRPARPQSSPVETPHNAAESSVDLVTAADDLAAEKGLRAGSMMGADFIAVVEEAARRLSRDPGTGAAAKKIHGSMVRVIRALIAPDAPLRPQMGRLLGVLQVFNQEMVRIADETGSVQAVVDEAALFASQVEASV